MASVALGRHTLEYEIAGEGPALVLLHGIGSNRLSWKRQLADLSADFTVLAWDTPGYGLSSDPVSEIPNIEEYAECVAAWIEDLKLGPVHLLGHSLGGIIAQETYKIHPGVVRTLTLADTTRGGGTEEAEVRKAKLARRLEMIERLGPEGLAMERTPELLSKDVPNDVLEEAVSIMAQVRPSGYCFAAAALSEADERDILRKISVPTLLVWAADDRVIPRSEVEEMRRLLPHARCEVIPDAGHLCYQEKSAVFNALVREFCLSHS